MNNGLKFSMGPIVLAIALASSAPASGADKTAAIASVVASTNTVTIHGANFTQKAGQLQVFLSGFSTPLLVSSYNNDTIVAFLPPGVPPGSYVLTLGKSIDDGSAEDFFLTLGVQGAKGDKGDTGAPGPQGVKGDSGGVGPQGAKGDTGTTGAQGAQGIKGDTGGIGPQGSQGPKGDAGAGFHFRGAWIPGSPALVGDVMAYNGAAYVALVATNTTSPPPSSTDWALFVAQGPQGDIGPQGVKGDTGATGATGGAGPQGAKGDTGSQGIQGVKGDTGTTGAQGAQGIKGDTGDTGPQGPAGTLGDSPSISGNLTLGASTTTAGNIFKGAERFIHNFGGLGNTFVGVASGNFTTSGAQNTGSGADALKSNTSGASNTAIGSGALLANTTGARNIALGANAGSKVTTGSNNIHIGNDGVASDTSTIRIGRTQSPTFIAGIAGASVGSVTYAVRINDNGQLGTVRGKFEYRPPSAVMSGRIVNAKGELCAAGAQAGITSGGSCDDPPLSGLAPAGMTVTNLQVRLAPGALFTGLASFVVYRSDDFVAPYRFAVLQCTLVDYICQDFAPFNAIPIPPGAWIWVEVHSNSSHPAPDVLFVFELVDARD